MKNYGITTNNLKIKCTCGEELINIEIQPTNDKINFNNGTSLNFNPLSYVDLKANFNFKLICKKCNKQASI